MEENSGRQKNSILEQVMITVLNLNQRSLDYTELINQYTDRANQIVPGFKSLEGTAKLESFSRTLNQLVAQDRILEKEDNIYVLIN